MVYAGELAPEFSLPTANTEPLTLAEVRSRGHAVLYFYPKDDTPGCTLEALEFTELQAEFAQAHTKIIAISRDSCASHRAFRDKYGLTVHLLADVTGVVCAAYDVLRDKTTEGGCCQNILRSTFIIDANGLIRHAFYDVNPTGHAAAMLDLVRQLATP
jgi:thioredoxin-dependent peroxiredoxin